MLVNCNSCQKKFNVPDSAVTEAGRLLQCGSCGNKWTQYPIKKDSVKEEKLKKEKNERTPTKPKTNKIKTAIKKKKREINLYSEEYLKKKHGLEIKDSLDVYKKQKKLNNSNFFKYFTISIIFLVAFFGVLNLTKKSIIINYPFIETYINYLYEALESLIVKISSLIN